MPGTEEQLTVSIPELTDLAIESTIGKRGNPAILNMKKHDS